jgi:hypothetical protein
VKASDVSRNLALSKLEKQLGAYREIHHLAQSIYEDKSKTNKPQPLDNANRNSENWNAYIRARAESSKGNKERREQLYMTQQKERKEQRDRQKLERQALSQSFVKGVARQYINKQRSILATKHAYARAVLKERHKEERESLKTQSAVFISYEQWLRSLNMPEEAEKWRHRKNRRILLLERPDDTTNNTPQEYTGLAGFSMTVTTQGVKFTSQDKPGAVAFIDVGRVIKVYDQGDSSLLASLRLAQSKWGGVQVNGTEAYKRKCAEIAVKNGIRISNSELQEYMKELERREKAARQKTTAAAPISFDELKKRWIKLKAKLDKAAREIAEPRIAEAAKRQIEMEAEKIAAERAAVYKEYLEAEAERNAHAKKEPMEPLLFGHAQWEREHDEWDATDRAMSSRTTILWEKAGGRKYGYGQEEVERRLIAEYAREEAKKCYSVSAEWRAIRANIESEARLEAERNAPETKAALDAVAREIQKRASEEKRNQRIAELDRGFEKGTYPPGTMGFRLQVDRALEVLKLERERGRDEREALRLHPGATAVLEKAEEYRKRERGMGR